MPITVQSGDTLSALASQYGTSVDALVEANPEISDPDFIQVGQQLNIPGADGSPPPQISGAAGLNLDKMPEQYRQWVPYVEDAASRVGLPPALVFAVMSRETNGYNVIGDYGHGRGLMQI